MPRLKLNILEPRTPWTKTPNVLLDRLIPTLGDTELRVLLILIRQTHGWNRADRVVTLSYRVLMERTGRHSAAIARAIRGLETKGLIHRARSLGEILAFKAKQKRSKSEQQQ